MNIIIFGSPGSGKGTQAKLLAEFFRLKRISLGDILRQEVKKESSLGKQVEAYMEEGKLVPDELVSKVIEENINKQVFILDGYPRNLSQAKRLDKILSDKNKDIDAFIYLDIDQQIIVDRLSKRIICRNCGVNYHLDNMPPKQEGICDICGEVLSQRKDDNINVIKKRWEVFTKESAKILDFYKNKNKLINIDGRGDKEDIFKRIRSQLR